MLQEHLAALLPACFIPSLPYTFHMANNFRAPLWYWKIAMRLLSAILSAQGQRISVLVLHRVIFNSVFFTAEVSFNFKSSLQIERKHKVTCTWFKLIAILLMIFKGQSEQNVDGSYAVRLCFGRGCKSLILSIICMSWPFTVCTYMHARLLWWIYCMCWRRLSQFY